MILIFFFFLPKSAVNFLYYFLHPDVNHGCYVLFPQMLMEFKNQHS